MAQKKMFVLLLALTCGLCALADYAAAATRGGVTPINQSNIPYTINRSGSYKLTSDLRVPNPSTQTAITDAASDVTIDLNGFSIIGGVYGIYSHPDTNLVTVFNGEVSGMQAGAIFTGHTSRIERVRVFGNAGFGIWCTDGCEISHNVVNNNGSGITVDKGVVSSNVVQFNNLGISVGAALVTGNSVSYNATNGLLCVPDGASNGGAYSNNVFFNNGAFPTGCLNLGQNACSGSPCP